MAQPLSISKESEKDLLARVAEGDESAFEELFKLHHQRLGRYIFSVLQSAEMTEDIVQDVFVKVWQTRESLSKINSFSDYLFIITRNQAISALRKLSKERKLAEEVVEFLAMNNSDEQKEMGLSLIDEAVNLLPPQQQQCFILSRRERFTYEEIAGQMGIARETVKTHIKLAVVAITRHVQDNMDKALLLLWLTMQLN